MAYIPECVVNGEIDSSWTHASKNWGHSMHRICSRVGAVPPKMAHYFIMKYSNPGDTILDPFSGKGTIPFEASLNARHAVGNDFSNEAFILTKSKLRLTPLNDFVFEYLPSIRREASTVSIKDIEDEIDNKDLLVFYNKDVLKDILKLRFILNNKHRLSDNDFFLSSITLSLLHGSTTNAFSIPCSHSYSMSPKYVRSYISKYNKQYPHINRFDYSYKDIWMNIAQKAMNVWANPLPEDYIKGRAYKEDTSKLLDKFNNNGEKFNLILTSPPYLDAITYAWDNWLRLWFLGLDYRDIRKKLFVTGSKDKYFTTMVKYVNQMYGTLDDDSPCLLILGDVKKKDVVINTAKELANHLIDQGTEFKVKRIWRDKIPKNKKTLTYVDKENGIKYERILELHKGNVKRKKKSIQW